MSRVDQRVGTGAGRVRRLLSRALLVVGGTLAGSAAAWVLAAAPASAQEPVDQVTGATSLTDVTGTAPHSRFEATLDRASLDRATLSPATLDPAVPAPVGVAVRDLDTALRTPQVREPSPPAIGRVTGDLRDAVDHVGGWFQARTSTSSTTGQVVGAAAQRVTEATPAATAVPVSAGTPVVQGVPGTSGRTWPATSRQSSAGLPDDTVPSLPGDPSGVPSMPIAPLGAPAHCSCGGDVSGSSGGGNGPFSAVSADRIDAAVARALFPATERNVAMPGKQPGITPD